MFNYSCYDLCITLANNPQYPATDNPSLRALRLILLILSGFALLKELFQVLTQREKYFRRFYINLIELHMYVSINQNEKKIDRILIFILFSIDQCNNLFS
jgi:cytochrome b subunit of formate dehydrogenase